MKLTSKLDQLLFPLMFALFEALPWGILFPICLVKTDMLACQHLAQFGLVPARIIENGEIYRIVSATFFCGTPWEVILNAAMVFTVVESAQTRICLERILMQCAAVSTIAAIVQIVYALCVANTGVPFFDREYYMPEYGMAPFLIFLATQNLRSGKMNICVKIPRLVLSFIVLLITFFVEYPFFIGWMWCISGFVIGWLWPVQKEEDKVDLDTPDNDKLKM